MTRTVSMNRYRRLILPVTIAVLLTACAPTGSESEPSSVQTPHDTPTMRATPMPSDSPASSATPRASASASDMADEDGGGSTESVTVDIANFAFVPADLRIAAGTTVVFTNSDSAPHTATAGTDDDPLPGRFDAGLLQPGESFSVTFDEPGSYAYFCERHPPMTGVIVVEG